MAILANAFCIARRASYQEAHNLVFFYQPDVLSRRRWRHPLRGVADHNVDLWPKKELSGY